MTRTPWGDATDLREHRLYPGAGTPRAAVLENQRQRLFAALVATVAEQGYEASTVEDVLALSGVSRKAFYEHFSSKEDCMVAAVEALIEPTLAVISRAEGLPRGEEQARLAWEAFIELVISQAAASRLCFVEIHAAGERAVESIERATAVFEDFIAEICEGMPGRAGMPREIVRAVIGGLRKIIHTRLYRREEEELRELSTGLWEWGLSYMPPPRPLRSGRASRRGTRGPEGRELDERLLRATAAVVGEKGYQEATVADIVRRASSSLSSFYARFSGKQEAVSAALDSGSSQMVAVILPAYRRGADWPAAVRMSVEAMFGFGAAEPDYTRLGAVELYAAGHAVLEQRDQVMAGLQALMMPGYELAPETPPIVAEAVAAAVYSLIYEQVRSKGPESLPQIVPLATYVALAPFLGAEEACEVANGSGRR